MIVRIIGDPYGRPTDLDGRWVVEYDPSRDGMSPNGDSLLCHLVTTDDPSKALRFENAKQALEYCMRSHGLRKDGKLNRPLTGLTTLFEEDFDR